MMEQVFSMMYMYIMKTEVFLLHYYHLDSVRLMHEMTVLDLQYYMQLLEEEAKKEKESIKGKDLWTALISIRDILNMVTLNRN